MIEFLLLLKSIILGLAYIFWRKKIFLGRWKKDYKDPDSLNLTPDDYDKLKKEEKFNLCLLKELLRQAELKVQNEDARKQRIDSRAYQMIGVSIGIITYFLGKYFDIEVKSTEIIIFITFTVIYCSVIVILLVYVLIPKKYAALGSKPATSLLIKKSPASEEYVFNHEGIKYQSQNFSKQQLSYKFIKGLIHYNESLSESERSNDSRGKQLNLSFELIIFYFIILVVCTIYSVMYLK